MIAARHVTVILRVYVRKKATDCTKLYDTMQTNPPRAAASTQRFLVCMNKLLLALQSDENI